MSVVATLGVRLIRFRKARIMLITPWFRTFQQTLARKLSRGLATHRRSHRRVNTVARAEHLEDRSLLTTYMVTNILDSGAGSLRQAIIDANTTVSVPDQIHFNIAIPGPYKIQPQTPLPTITDEVDIDGYTQIFTSVNSATTGTNAQLLIELSGDFPGTTATNGLTIKSGNSTVRGLVVNRFTGNGIELLAGTTGSTIQGNFIGTDRSGITALPNRVGLSLREASNGNTIGGSLPRDRNLISANSQKGIELGTSNNTVRGNLIGTNASGTSGLGSQIVGIQVTGFPSTPGTIPSPGQNNLIGGLTKDDSNTIAFNRTGVVVDKGVTTIIGLNKNNQILGNSIFSNGLGTGLGIDLEPANTPGVTSNDVNDADLGPNNLQNFPVITSVMGSGTLYIATYSVPSSVANSAYPMRVEFFRADANMQEGKEFLGADVYAAPGVKTFTFPAGTAFLFGDRVVATATDGLDPVGLVAVSGSTSEFSASVLADPCTLIVTTTADAGPGSFREAINCANAHPGLDTISFNIGTGLQTINVLSPLPVVTDKAIIDGTTQPGFDPMTCVPIIELNGANAGLLANGLVISAGNSVVRGLVINRFQLNGIRLLTNGTNVVAGNYLGTDITGTMDLGNTLNGVFVDDSSRNVIGGLNACDRNVISGNDLNGVSIRGSKSTLNRVVGNYVGTTVDGLLPLGNRMDGVQTSLSAASNTIGGNTASSRNIISANGSDGVELGTLSNTVQKNYIGTDLNGNKGAPGLGNTLDGVRIKLARNSILNNVVSGNLAHGVEIEATSLTPGNVVRGNLIGTNAAGQAIVVAPNNGTNGNGLNGVEINGSPNNRIGGPGLGAKNIISGNKVHGVHLIGAAAKNNVVQGNYIGTDVTGTVDMGNTIDGVGIDSAPTNTIGGPVSGAGNLISGNGGNGVEIFNTTTAATSIFVQGNLIGTDVSGMSALPNFRGVYIFNANSNRVGGGGLNDGNLISGNLLDGVFLRGTSSMNVLEGNSIGVDMNGGALGNGSNGVTVQGSNNRIGGLSAVVGFFTSPNAPDNAANVIAFNGGNGVSIATGIGNAIRRNSIFDNFSLGINHFTGGNALLAAPVITPSSSGMTAAFTTTAAGRVEFFVVDNLASGAGAVFVTDRASTGTGTVAFTGLVPNLSILVATFTDANGNTSRFSAPFMVTW